MSFTAKQFQKYLDRDGWICLHCGTNDDTLIPGHRLGRGAGGSKLRDVPSNIETMCSWLNNEVEVNAVVAIWAMTVGLKLDSGQNPLETPVWNIVQQRWLMFDDEFGAHPVEKRRPTLAVPHERR